MWNYLETFYHEQGAEDSGYVTEQYLRNLAAQVPGLNLAKWTQATARSPNSPSQIEADAQAANSARLHRHAGLPDRPHRRGPQTLEYTSLEDPKSFNEAIEEATEGLITGMRARRLRIALIVLASIGVALAGYLTYVHYSGTEPPCSIKGNPCSQVQKSQYSELAGHPRGPDRPDRLHRRSSARCWCAKPRPPGSPPRRSPSAASASALYLTYREVFTLEKICEWCVGSAILMTIMMLLSLWRFLLPGTTVAPPGGPPDGLTADDEPLGSAAESSPALGASS